MTSVAVLLLDFASAFKYISGLVAFVLYHFVICYMGTSVTAAVSNLFNFIVGLGILFLYRYNSKYSKK